MTFRGRRIEVDWGHLAVLCLIAGSTAWYLMDARAVSLDAHNLLLVEPLARLAHLIQPMIHGRNGNRQVTGSQHMRFPWTLRIWPG